MQNLTLKIKIENAIFLQKMIARAYFYNNEGDLIQVGAIDTAMALAVLRPFYLKLTKEVALYFTKAKNFKLQPAELCALRFVVRENLARFKKDDISLEGITHLNNFILKEGLMQGLYLETTKQRVLKEHYATKVISGKLTFEEAEALIVENA